MLTMEHVMTVLGAIVIASPVLLVFILGISSLLDHKLSEQTTTTVLQAGTVSGLLAALAVLLAMLILGTRHVPIELGDWVVIPGQYHFSIKFVFDRLSVPMAILSFTLSGTIGAFASRYMHRDAGYNRFFVLYTLFVLGMVATSLAGTIETLFAGWELVGLSSALLVAFFQERKAPARNGLWVWTIYRFSDAALLLAAVATHHLRGEGDFDKLLGTGLWPEVVPSLTSHQGLLVGLLVLVAAAGKSALVPFSGWLPRAMEGPTPSSAVFYGGALGPSGGVPALAGQPAPGFLALAFRGGGAGGRDDRCLRISCRQCADRHQVGSLVCLSVPGRDHRDGDWPGFPLRRLDSHPWPRVPADTPVREGSHALA